MTPEPSLKRSRAQVSALGSIACDLLPVGAWRWLWVGAGNEEQTPIVAREVLIEPVREPS